MMIHSLPKLLNKKGIITLFFIACLAIAIGQNPASGFEVSFTGVVEQMQQAEEQTVLLKNQNNTIPFRSLNQGKFALVSIGENQEFISRVMNYLEMPVFRIHENNIGQANDIFEKIQTYDRLILVISSLEVESDIQKKIIELGSGANNAVVFFAAPNNLNKWSGIENANTLLLSQNNHALAQDVSAQILFGGIRANGKLTEAIAGMFEKGEGLTSQGGIRMKYTVSEEVGINGQLLTQRIDSIVENAINKQAFPGCQVLLAKNGKVFFWRSYGHHTYNNRNKVKNNDLYDLASVTKICGALPLIMQMDGDNLIDLDKPFSTYWPDWQKRWFHRSNKDTLTLRQLLTHQARLNPYLPFWRQSQKNGQYNAKLYRQQKTEGYSLEIDDHLYLSDKFRNNVYRSIRKSELMPKVEYKYSCLSFIIYPGMITKLTGEDYEQQLYNKVYRPIGASRLVYNPLQKGFSKEEIPPTEEDIYFRKNLVHGRVHDEAAAAMGGISGNAGLFASANDLAKLMHLYLNMGFYGGEQLISRQIMEEYIQPQFNGNRRAIGFDKPLPDNASKSLNDAWPAPGASEISFGHSGFTGTFVWIDPENQLVYIFLSNRVYPSRTHNNISRLNVRTAIQQVAYDELKNSNTIKSSENK